MDNLKTFSNSSDRIQYLKDQTNYKVTKTKTSIPSSYSSYTFKQSFTNGYKKCNCPQLIFY